MPNEGETEDPLGLGHKPHYDGDKTLDITREGEKIDAEGARFPAGL